MRKILKKRRNETLVDSKRGAKGGRTRISVIEEDEPNRTFKALPTAASIAPNNSITSTTTTSDTTIPDISTTTANNKAEMIRREKALQLKEAIRLKIPTYIRLGKKGEPIINSKNKKFDIGKVDILKKGKNIKITFDDWIFMQDERVAINRATMTKFGIKVAELTVMFVKD